MGSLRGDLSVLGVANLLQTLAFSRCEGLLTLELGTQPRVLYLHPSGLRLIRGSRGCQRLEKFLRSPAGLARGSESIARVATEWILDEVCDLLGWTRGTFRFQESPELPERGGMFTGLAPDCDLLAAILEAARRADEMPRLRLAVPHLDAVPEGTGTPLQAEDPTEADAFRDIIPLIDGNRSVGEILQESIFPRFTVFRAFARLAAHGAVLIPRPAQANSAA